MRRFVLSLAACLAAVASVSACGRPLQRLRERLHPQQACGCPCGQPAAQQQPAAVVRTAYRPAWDSPAPATAEYPAIRLAAPLPTCPAGGCR